MNGKAHGLLCFLCHLFVLSVPVSVAAEWDFLQNVGFSPESFKAGFEEITISQTGRYTVVYKYSQETGDYVYYVRVTGT